MEKSKRYVVVSTNNNPDYYFYLPYIEKAWNAYGWDVCCMVTHDVPHDQLKRSNENTIVVRLPEIPELRIETVAQASRLYAANYLPLDAIIMTSDMDLLPLADYWNPTDAITVYGHDLTDYTYIPMGYIAMSGNTWKHVMRLNYDTLSEMLRDAKEYEHLTSSDNWESWWNYDWTMISDRLKPLKESINFITRGRQSNGFAYGRIDRGNSLALIPKPWIDLHGENNNVLHPDKLSKFLAIFEEVYGKI